MENSVGGKEVKDDKVVFVDGIGVLKKDTRRWGEILKLDLLRQQDRFVEVEINGQPTQVSLTAVKFNPKDGGVKVKGRYVAPKANGTAKKLRRKTFWASEFETGQLPSFVE